MSWELDLGDGNVLDVPDNATDQEISAAIKQLTQKNSDTLPKPQTLEGQATNIIRNLLPPVSRSTLPPLTSQELIQTPSPIQSRFGTMLSNAGEQVRSAALGSAENIVNRGTLPPSVAATLGTGIHALAKVAPLTPEELTLQIGGEAMPIPFVSKAMEKMPESIMNRFLNATKSIADSRLRNGEVNIGEDFLKQEVFNPQKFGALPVSDKKEIFNIAKSEISKLGKSIDSQISQIKDKVNLSKVFDKRILKNTIDNMLKGFEKYMPEDQVSLLKKVKNSKQIDFKTFNDFRKLIGEEVGKRFEKVTGELPEFVQAQKDIFAKTRQYIEDVAPNLSSDLKQQHIFYDIKNSVAPAAAKGYSPIATTVGKNAVKPFSSPTVAGIIESIGKSRVSGRGLASGLAIPAFGNKDQQ